MTPFLPPDAFNLLYPQRHVLSRTLQSKVFATGTGFVVKSAGIDWALNDVCYLTKFNHPNIIALSNYTIIFHRSALVIKYAMPLGEPATSIYNHPEEFPILMHDITSALSYLRDQGFVHADVKPGNILRFPGRDGERTKYVLIDLGMVRPIMLFESGPVFTGKAYTLPFRDPELYGRYTPISAEIFALGQTFRALLLEKANLYASIIKPGELRIPLVASWPMLASKEDELQALISSMIGPSSQRVSYADILNNPLLEGIEPSPPREKEDSPEQKDNSVIPTISSRFWTQSVECFFREGVSEFYLDLKGIFITMLNVKRCMHLLSKENLLTGLLINAYIATNLLATSGSHYEDLMDYFGDEFSPSKFIPLLIQILAVLQSDPVPETEWDWCRTPSDVLLAYGRLFSPPTTSAPERPDIVPGPILNANYNNFANKISSHAGVYNLRERICWNCTVDSRLSELKRYNVYVNEDNKLFNKLFLPSEDVGIVPHIHEYLRTNSDLGNSFVRKLRGLKLIYIKRYLYYFGASVMTLFEMSDIEFHKIAKRGNSYLLLKFN